MQESPWPYLVTLEQHGLTAALLERFATFCASGKTGSFVFHTGTGGTILAYEEHHRSKVQALDDEGCPSNGSKRRSA